MDTQIKKPEPVSAAQNLSDWRQKITRLHDRLRLLTEIIVSLERSAGTHIPDSLKAAAERLLDEEVFAPSSGSPLTQLEILYQERHAINRALEIAAARCVRLERCLSDEIYDQHRAEIAELEKSRVTALLALQKINRQRERLRDRLHQLGCGHAWFPTDAAEMCGVDDTADENRTAVARAVKEGVLTRKEAQNAQS